MVRDLPPRNPPAARALLSPPPREMWWGQVKIGLVAAACGLGAGGLALLWRRHRARQLRDANDDAAAAATRATVAVTVASTSAVKRAAVRRAFAGVFPGVVVVGVSAPSQVNEQPVGLAETRAGAEHRLAAAAAFARNEQRLGAAGTAGGAGGGALHFVVSVENGVVRLPAAGGDGDTGTQVAAAQQEDHRARWVDLAVVIVAVLGGDDHGDGNSSAAAGENACRGCHTRAYALSAGVEVPVWSVEEARRSGFGTTTVGSVLAARRGTRAARPGRGGGGGTTGATAAAVDEKDPHTFLTSGASPRASLLEGAVRSALGTLQRKLLLHNNKNY